MFRPLLAVAFCTSVFIERRSRAQVVRLVFGLTGPAAECGYNPDSGGLVWNWRKFRGSRLGRPDAETLIFA